MVTEGYKKYIASDKWKAKRQQVFQHYGKRCFACRRTPKILHVHHLSYARLGKEPLADLIPLCVDCHKEVTAIYRRSRQRGLRRVSLEFVKAKRRMILRRR